MNKLTFSWKLALGGLLISLAPATLSTTAGFTSSIREIQDKPLSSGATRRFEDYPAQRFTGKPAAPIITTRRARLFRTMIREDARAGPNFAGHYTIARWGCGSSCVGFAIIDAGTGRVYFHPKALQIMQVPYQIEDVLQFRPDSRLLIISGEILPVDPNSSSGADSTGKFYYEWKNNRFTLLERGSVKKEEGAPSTSSDYKQLSTYTGDLS